jgi:hypothetical protein
MKISEKDPGWWTMYALFAPIITWPGYEKDNSDKKMLVQKARFEKIFEGDKSERATDAEVAIYLSTATLVSPVNSDWAEVYMHAAKNAFPELKGVMGNDGNKDLTAEQKRLYDDLAKWIYKKQVAALKGKERLRA